MDNYDSIHVTSVSQVQIQMMIDQFDDPDNDCEEFTSCEMSVVLLCCTVLDCCVEQPEIEQHPRIDPVIRPTMPVLCPRSANLNQSAITPLLSPATKWKGDIGLGAVRPSVIPSFRLSRNRFRSITQKLFHISKPNLIYS